MRTEDGREWKLVLQRGKPYQDASLQWRIDSEPGWVHYEGCGGMTTWNWEAKAKTHILMEPTMERVNEAYAKEAAAKAWGERQAAAESELLALCGLTHGDFVRFRNVYRDGGTLHVETRENGVDAVSVGAIRNPNYRSQHTDDGDCTYEHYEFAIPKAGA